MPESAHPTRVVLRIPAVRHYLVSRFFSSLGRSLLHATIAWHIWKVTDSYFWLGVIGFVEFLPVIPVSLYAGAVADTHDRRNIVLATQGVSLLGSLALALGTGAFGFERELILVAAFVLAMSSCFENPAGASILPNLVPRALFPAATVVNANFRNIANVSGPVLMGIVSGSLGISAAYATTVTCLAISLLALRRVTLPPVPGAEERDVSFKAIREGITFVRAQPAILGSMTLDMFAVIFAGATALLPVYADQILGVGEFGYGLLSASMQIGTVSMAALLLMIPAIERPGRALLISVLFFGLATIIFGLSRSFPLSVAAFVLAGMADQVSMVTRTIILQLSTPDSLRGRVNSVNMIFIGASNELGAAESGFLAALTSATFSVVAGGFACLGILGIVSVYMPELRHYTISGAIPDPDQRK
ncbi:MAG: MFS transporter [bacterium]|nr:MFS transporter [bacterium]